MIQTVHDVDIPIHIHNITQDIPPLLYPQHSERPEAKVRFQQFQRARYVKRIFLVLHGVTGGYYSLVKNVLTADSQATQQKQSDGVVEDA
jgi:hypothetical protein